MEEPLLQPDIQIGEFILFKQFGLICIGKKESDVSPDFISDLELGWFTVVHTVTSKKPEYFELDGDSRSVRSKEVLFKFDLNSLDDILLEFEENFKEINKFEEENPEFNETW